MLSIRGKQRNGEGENLFSLSPFSCFHCARGGGDLRCVSTGLPKERRTAYGRPYGVRFLLLRAETCLFCHETVSRKRCSEDAVLGCGVQGLHKPLLRSFLTLRAETCLFCHETVSRKRCSEDAVLGCGVQGLHKPLLRLSKPHFLSPKISSAKARVCSGVRFSSRSRTGKPE